MAGNSFYFPGLLFVIPLVGEFIQSRRIPNSHAQVLLAQILHLIKSVVKVDRTIFIPLSARIVHAHIEMTWSTIPVSECFWLGTMKRRQELNLLTLLIPTPSSCWRQNELNGMAEFQPLSQPPPLFLPKPSLALLRRFIELRTNEQT